MPSGVGDVTGDPDFRAVGGDHWTASTSGQYEKNCGERRQLWPTPGIPTARVSPPSPTSTAHSDNHKAIGEALQSQWQTALGVTVKLENQDWSVFLETRKQGQYQIATTAGSPTTTAPSPSPDMARGSGSSDAQYSSADCRRRYCRGKGQLRRAGRMDAMHRAEDIIIGQDWALGPIYFYTQKCMSTPTSTACIIRPGLLLL